MRKYLAILGIVTILLAGCSAAAGPSISLSPKPSQPTAPSTQGPPAETAPEGADEEPLGGHEIKEIVLASFLAFEEQGMTERALSQGDEFDLLFDPTMEDYQAVLLDRANDSSELIYETDYFTIFVLYLMAEASSGTFAQEDAGVFLAQDPNYGNIRFFAQDGLIRSAEGMDQSWQATFEYSVDPDLRKVLLAERQKLLDSFEE